MKRTGCFLLAVLLLFLTACGGKEEVPYMPGTFTDAGYASEYIGYRFTTPQGCTLMSLEEREHLMGIVTGTLGDDVEGLQNAYADQAVIYDMVASLPDGANVNVVCSRCSTDQMTSDQLVRDIKKQLAAQSAMKATVADVYEEVSFAGGSYVKMTAEVAAEGARMNQEYYVCIKPGYVVNITFTYAPGSEADRDVLAGAFSAY